MASSDQPALDPSPRVRGVESALPATYPETPGEGLLPKGSRGTVSRQRVWMQCRLVSECTCVFLLISPSKSFLFTPTTIFCLIRVLTC